MDYKILGLLGGIGPESTIDYYKMIIKKFREKLSTNDYPNFLINNIDMTEMLRYVKENRLDDLSLFLAKEFGKLEDAGAQFGAMASNTPHLVFEDVQKKINMPLVSIVEETIKEIGRRKFNKAALFGTLSTMNGGFYQRAGGKFSVEVITPSENLKEYINKVYFEELVAGIVKASTKNELKKIISDMKDSHGIQGIILGGTELPLILNQDDFPNIAVFNTSEIHVESILNKMLE